jgi:hypothetical protein
MTIPIERLITQITNALISSGCSKKQYMFRTIKCFDGLDVTITIYLLDKTINISSYYDIKSNVMGIEGNIYFTGTFYSDANVAVKKSMEELYRVPNFKVDKLRGSLWEYIDEEHYTTYIKSELCSLFRTHIYKITL